MKNKKIDVYAPLGGKIKYLSKLDDKIFSSELIGEGVAIIPKENSRQLIRSPIKGKIKFISLDRHSLVIKTKQKQKIYINIGVENNRLPIGVFNYFVKKGQKVKKGQNLLEIDFTIFESKNNIKNITMIMEKNHHSQLKIINSNELNTLEKAFEIIK